MSELWWLVAGAALILAAAVYLVQKRKHPKPGLPEGVTLRFTHHANERMTQRGITSDQVTSVLVHSERRESDPKENSVRLERDFEGRTLKVWVAEPWPATQEIVVKSAAWHYFTTVTIPIERKGLLIGRAGRTIDEIRASTRAHISVKDDGTVDISAGNSHSLEAAREKIEAIANRPLTKVGERYLGTVTKLLAHGAIVASPTRKDGLIPVAKLRPLVGGKRIDDLSQVITLGQQLHVEVDEIRNGKPRLIPLLEQDADRTGPSSLDAGAF